jgi:hypothetical protein
MTKPRSHSQIGQFMVEVVIVALILTLIAGISRLPSELQQKLPAIMSAIGMFLLLWSPLIIEGVRNFRRLKAINPRTRRTPLDL